MRVSPETLQFVQAKFNKGFREMTANELDALAAALGVDAKELRGPFLMGPEYVCGCGRQLSFVDVVGTAKKTGHHSNTILADILCGRAGFWLTVAGSDDSRAVECTACHTATSFGSHNYSSRTYAYA
eukprot:TRINITY_DN286_c0_g1_i1.p2 TRINITY_DN286_c0_g1~~TRINITY_DN286_c0_g1_i1.p2  ORF type:complete len:127 (-),score=29.54 TRINITY_DN286_c0_g1_i1:138-518(-)